MMSSGLRRLVASRWLPGLLLAVSVVLDVVVTELGQDPFDMIDLAVYVQGAGHLTDGRLYDFLSGASRLPFTYPPFSALVFEPLHWLPWTLARVLWGACSIGALTAILYLTLRLLGRAGPRADRPIASLRGTLLVGTAAAMWLEPVRTNFNYGQINLFLATLVLGAAVVAKDWLAGTYVGLAAGIKLVPAITGFYLLAQRRFAAAIWSGVVFLATIGLMLAIIPRETRRYFTALVFDPARTGPIYSAINQSWRGALARLAGQDGSAGSMAWIVLCLLTVLLGVWALWRASAAGDRTGALLAAQLTGLLVSPISWSHHWIWVLPLLTWAFFGPAAGDRRVRWLAGAWLVAVYSYVVPILVALQGKVPVSSRPGWQSALGLVYPVLGAATLLVLVAATRRAKALSVPSGTTVSRYDDRAGNALPGTSRGGRGGTR